MLVVLGEPGGVGVQVSYLHRQPFPHTFPAGGGHLQDTFHNTPLPKGSGSRLVRKPQEAESELQGKVRMDFTIWGK